MSASSLSDGETAAFDAVLVHDHRDAFEIAGEHERLVAGEFRIEQQRAAGGDDLGHVLAGDRAVPSESCHFCGRSSFLLL